METGDILKGRDDSYRVGDMIGSGGVGKVFKARALGSGRKVAVKVLHGLRFSKTDTSSRRMMEEIELSCTLENSHVVRGLDYGETPDGPFLVLEWMPGGPLSSRIDSLEPEQAIRWFCQILKGYEGLRIEGIVHRDLKPNNILLDERARAKIADLGVAKVTSTHEHLTMTGDHMGSLLYISDRQRRDPALATHRDDFYAICLIMYELASGKRVTMRKPPLSSMQASALRVPADLALLIDDGIADTEEWFELYQEMRKFLDLENEVVNDAYAGSVFVPTAAVRTWLEALDDTAAPVPSGLAEEILGEISRGFHDVARKLARAGATPFSWRQDSEDPAMFFSVELVARFHEQMPERQQEEEGRMYGFVMVVEDGPPKAGLRLFTSGKRLYIDHIHADASIYDLVFLGSLSPEERHALFRFGRGVALDAAIAYLKWATDHEGYEDDE